MKNYIKFILYGFLFLGIQEFWINILWNGNLIGFILAIIIMEFLFLSIGYLVLKLFEKKFSKAMSSFSVYIIFGLLGLIVIEWIYAGNNLSHPDNGNLWSQFVMFTNWAGIIIFPKIMIDGSDYVLKLKKQMYKFFTRIIFIVTIIAFIFVFINPQITFVITLITMLVLWPAMNYFFLKYFNLLRKNKKLT